MLSKAMQKEMENPEDAFMNILKLSNNDITDATRVMCDICCLKTSATDMGGAVLLEKKGSTASSLGMFTFCCGTCLRDFVMVDEKNRIAKSDGQRSAMKYGVGTNPEKYLEFDKTKTFKENVLKFKKDNPQLSRWRILIEDSPSKEESNYKNRGFQATCNSCKKVFIEQNLMRCGRCKLARYCSKECQKYDWANHKRDCDLSQ